MHVNIAAISLALAGPALAGVLTKISSTTTLDIWVTNTPLPTSPTSPTSIPRPTLAPKPTQSCYRPKDIDRHWEAERTLNDTTDHHKSFKLFMETDFGIGEHWKEAIHVQEIRPDIWNLRIGEPDADNNTAATTKPLQQPRWNLKKGMLQTDNSAPIKDILYFRFWADELRRDSRLFWQGKRPKVFSPVLTTNNNKRHYHAEKNAELVGRDGWQLVRDGEKTSYDLVNRKVPGHFWMCLKVPKELVDFFPELQEEMHKGEELDLKKASPSSKPTGVAIKEPLDYQFFYTDVLKDSKFDDASGEACFPIKLKVRLMLSSTCRSLLFALSFANTSQAEEWIH